MCRLPLACLNSDSDSDTEPRQGWCLAVGFLGAVESFIDFFCAVSFLICGVFVMIVPFIP